MGVLVGTLMTEVDGPLDSQKHIHVSICLSLSLSLYQSDTLLMYPFLSLLKQTITMGNH